MSLASAPAHLLLGPCPPCKHDDHAECWQYAPPPSIPAQRCACDAPHPRFMVRAGRGPLGEPGWVVWDFEENCEVGGWFAFVIPDAAQRMADMENGPAV